MKKPNFLSKYFSPVASTIDVNRPLVKTDFEVKLIEEAYKKPINFGGIEVGTPTQHGTHKTTFNQLLG